MSDVIEKIIPVNPFIKIPMEALQAARDLISDKVAHDSIIIDTSDSPVFVDCGGNLESITCPKCGAQISFDTWGELMDQAYESSFLDLDVMLPCCNSKESLNNLKYNYECGFSSCVISVLNPQKPIDDELRESIESLLRTKIKVVYANI
ncbi:MAG: hypothetical protein J5767_12090 [Paludibacteraceae bacterium]|nr:hypothetical protein [Paludibacteraceae bacterium]